MRMHARVVSLAAIAALAVVGCQVKIDATGNLTGPGTVEPVKETKLKATPRPTAGPTAVPTGAPTGGPTTPPKPITPDDPNATPKPPGDPTGTPRPPADDVIPTGPDGKRPEVVAWLGLAPESVTIAVKQERTTDPSGTTSVNTTITYKPDPPDVQVKLQAPAGSAGTTITAYEIAYEYTTPAQQAGGKPPIVLGPTDVPIPPISVPAGKDGAAGTPVAITIPVGARSLNQVFAGSPDQTPAQIVAQVQFKSDKKFPVMGKDLNVLKVSIPIRAL